MSTKDNTVPLQLFRMAVNPGFIDELLRLRSHPSLNIAFGSSKIWLEWSEESKNILSNLIALPGSNVFSLRNGLWYPLGSALPAQDVEDNLDFQPVSQALSIHLNLTTVSPTIVEPISWELEEDLSERFAGGMICRASHLAAWVKRVPSAWLVPLQCAVCGDKALVIGERLPTVFALSCFYVQDRVLIPLGYRIKPRIPLEMFRTIHKAERSDWLLLSHNGVEILSNDVMGELNRSNINQYVNANPLEASHG